VLDRQTEGNATMRKPLEIAAALEQIAEIESGEPLHVTSLMKLMYYVQGITLAETGKPLFLGGFEAWTHGPVEPSVWQFVANNRSRLARTAGAASAAVG
jgi:uncharacterized phage-associated protein